ncbi:cell division inhibitor SepF [Klenkia soli]|uniref:Cell division protein SepF n=1 Tax=Klenkia soli TaxID=1052260 RepID=A0A1H0M6S1_9ACTN|nr:cell division protein SepF [Klenkia soli]SDO76159.1 cell division inhibitor SepF [Klenkia soli]
MAGAMRKMGIYLGLVEDDDTRAAYGRYDARQSDYDDRAERRVDRRSTDRERYETDSRYDDRYDTSYPSAEYPSEELPVEALQAPPVAEPALPRRTGPRRLDLAAPATVGPRLSGSARGTASALSGGLSGGTATSGPVGATAAALQAPEPAPTPAPVVTPPVAAPKAYRITTLNPQTYNEARTIGERFREGNAVLMNLAEMEDADAKRLVDFAAGLSFGLHGSIERVTAKVFLLSPVGTDVTAEDKARIREGGFLTQS